MTSLKDLIKLCVCSKMLINPVKEVYSLNVNLKDRDIVWKIECLKHWECAAAFSQ